MTYMLNTWVNQTIHGIHFVYVFVLLVAWLISWVNRSRGKLKSLCCSLYTLISCHVTAMVLIWHLHILHASVCSNPLLIDFMHTSLQKSIKDFQHSMGTVKSHSKVCTNGLTS